MAHNISIYLIKKSELRDDKISEIVGKRKYGYPTNTKWVEMGEGMLATTDIQNFDKFKKDKTILFITTDYFSGFGSQTAKIYENGKVTFLTDQYPPSSDNYHLNPINEALRRVGIKAKDGLDQFDLVGLGNYRNNSDFLNDN